MHITHGRKYLKLTESMLELCMQDKGYIVYSYNSICGELAKLNLLTVNRNESRNAVVVIHFLVDVATLKEGYLCLLAAMYIK